MYKAERRDANPIRAFFERETPASHPQHADVVLIFGPKGDFTLDLKARQDCFDGQLDAEFVGDGFSAIEPRDLSKLRRSGRLGPDTHVFFIAHGKKEPAGHTLHLSNDQALTKQVISSLREPLDGVPPWTGPLHLLACQEAALRDEIDPQSDLWKAGPLLLYGGNSVRSMRLPGEEVPAVIRFIAQCKEQRTPVSGMDSFVHLANWTGECISIMGGDLEKPLIVHAPKKMDDVEPDALQAELRSLKAHQDLDEKTRSRVVGSAKDLDKLGVAVERHKERASGNPERVLTMFHVRADRGKPEHVANLLDAQPELLEHRGGAMGVTPLVRACGGRNLPVVELLLQRGADPNQITNDSRSPLGVAFAAKDLAMTGLLCRYGADPHRIAWGGKSIYEHAQASAQAEMLQAMDEESSKYTTLGKPITTTQANL